MKKITFILMSAILVQTGLFIPVAESGAAESKGKPTAAKAPKKAKSRTLKELIAYAEKHGSDKKLGQVEADDLGVLANVASKKLVYVLSGKPNVHLRSLWVIYDESSVPNSLIWSEFKAVIDGENRTTERWQYKSSLTGQIQRYIHGAGDARSASQSVMDVNEQVEKSFKDLISFFLVDAVRLEPESNK